MNTTFDENSCRICLRAEQVLNYSDEDAANYLRCTGFKIEIQDVPKKICEDCCMLLKNFRKFQEDSALVESELGKKTVVKSIVKAEPLDANAGAEQLIDENDDNGVETETPVKEEVEIKIEHKTRKSISRLLCDLCPKKKFINIPSLEKHMTKFHIEKVPKLIECFYCIQTFGSAKERKSHLAQMHKEGPKDRSYMCEICGKIFASLEYLKRHMGCVHESQEYFCDLCDNQQPIKGKVRLYEHMRYRHLRCVDPNVSHTCDVCGQCFAHSSSRRLHIMRQHTDKKMLPYQCTICPQHRGFVTKQAWRAHYRSHTGEKNFLCFCGDKFGTRNHLKQHQTSVHETKRFSCCVCHKQFNSDRYLKQHMKTHNQTAYVCPKCPMKGFSLTTTLRSHIKTNHPEMQLPPPGTILKNYNWNLHFSQ